MHRGDRGMTPAVANLAELYVAPGGPFFRLAQRLGIARLDRPSIRRRFVALLLVTWVPMCLFALVQGVALGPTPRESFLMDFATYARFFIMLPIILYADLLIGERLTIAGRQLVFDGIVGVEDYPAFEKAIARMARSRESVLVTWILLALASVGAWTFTYESASGMGLVGWRTALLPEGHAFRYNLAALWSQFVALPVVLYLAYRWIWRIIMWTRFLYDVSRLDLRLVPTHADKSGGLGFLEIAHVGFGVLAFGIGCVLSAEAAFRIVFEGAKLDFFQANTLILVAVLEVVFLGPLLMFMPAMARVRRDALRRYGNLVVNYNRAFQSKWVDGHADPAEPLLGSADIQSLADLGNSFRFVDDMRLMPFGRWSVIQIAVAALVPGVPLLLLSIPVRDIIDTLAKVVL